MIGQIQEVAQDDWTNPRSCSRGLVKTQAVVQDDWSKIQAVVQDDWSKSKLLFKIIGQTKK
jgi:hypothetical protein